MNLVCSARSASALNEVVCFRGDYHEILGRRLP